MANQRIDRTGHRYGRLLVLRCNGQKNHSVMWVCRCDCGNEILAPGGNLGRGRHLSCGCLARELSSERGRYHALGIVSASSPEYKTWIRIRKRCSDPTWHNYAHYGGRGIKVCEKWSASFEAFLGDVGLRPSPLHSLDRYPDNDGDYAPGNVRWGTKAQQSQNSRNVWLLDIDGHKIGVSEMARRLALQPHVLYEHFTRRERAR